MESTSNVTPQRDPERTAGGDGADFVAAAYPGPFRCPLCVTIVSVAHTFLEHMRSHGKDVRFLCGKCDRLWPTIHSVACHYSKCGRRVTRSARLPPIAIEDRPHTVACTDCGEQFTTATGLQLHRRSAHPEAFNADRPREKKSRWSQFEVLALATLEAELPRNIVNVNQVLSRQLFDKHGLSRNVEMIKGQRKKIQYKELVSSIQSGFSRAIDALTESSESQVYGSATSAVPASLDVLPDNNRTLPSEAPATSSAAVLPADA
ncbi:Reverse transcriptase, partial [Trichuris trichiura]